MPNSICRINYKKYDNFVFKSEVRRYKHQTYSWFEFWDANYVCAIVSLCKDPDPAFPKCFRIRTWILRLRMPNFVKNFKNPRFDAKQCWSLALASVVVVGHLLHSPHRLTHTYRNSWRRFPVPAVRIPTSTLV